MQKQQLVLIDGHALAYRAFYGLPLESFTTKQGEPTNAVYGFTRTLLELILSPEPPHYLAVSFDLGRTFRDDLFGEYKGTRAKMPDELDQQIERIKQVVSALNIPVLTLEGYEADDVLGTMAAQAKPHNLPVHIITGDRDLFQLADENTTIELPPDRYSRTPQIFTPAEVIAKMGVRPDQIVDYKALVGDTSDNIPGVKGIGEKTAIALLHQYQTLEGIYANLDQLNARQRNLLEAGRENATLSYELAKIITNAPITLDLAACVTQDFALAPVLELFHTLEFRTFSRQLQELKGAEAAEVMAAIASQAEDENKPTEAVLVQTSEQLQALAAQLAQAEMIAFDLETTDLDKQAGEIVGIALAIKPPTAYYIPVGHLATAGQTESGQMGLFASTKTLAEGQLPLAQVLEALRPALTNPAIPKVGHNAKFDYSFLQRYGITVTPISFDTMIAEWLTDPDSKYKSLKPLARHRLRLEMQEIETLIGKGKQQQSFALVPIAQAAPYGAADADATLRLVAPLRHEIRQMKLENLLDLEMPLIPVLASMEAEGVAIDVPYFAELAQELTGRLQELERQIQAIAGREFNVNSTQQLSDVLFKELDLPHERLRKTQSGYFSTANDVLEGLIPNDTTGIVRLLMTFRELGKLKSTYVEALPLLVNRQTGRLHTSFNQTGTVTGRIASSNPNLQNIPIRTAEGRKIRRGFVARPGWVFLAADYSQVELRILAHISQDAALLEAFRQDQDIHRTTAAAVHGVPVAEVTSEQRRFAKAVNFGLIYGMGAYRLARDSELTLAEANEFITTYFQRFPGIRRYLDGTKEQAYKKGYVETLFGRRRYFPELASGTQNRNSPTAQRAEREAINHPIQGTAADIIKVAMLALHKALQANFRARMLLQVHDELILEVPEEETTAVTELVINTMSTAFQLDIPLKVSASTGENWLALKD
jgi:DNA polymerase I